VIRRGIVIAGGLLVALGIALVAWPALLSEATSAVQRTVTAMVPASDSTLPSVIDVRSSASGGPQPSRSVLAGQPRASPTPTPTPLRPRTPGPPTVITPPVYAYPSPSDDSGRRHGGDPSPSPGRG
jgi:hypothetical protein